MRGASECLRSDAFRLCWELDDKTKSTQNDAGKKLGQRIGDVSYWKSEVQKEMDLMVAEIDALNKAKCCLERALEETENTLHICQECLYNREEARHRYVSWRRGRQSRKDQWYGYKSNLKEAGNQGRRHRGNGRDKFPPPPTPLDWGGQGGTNPALRIKNSIQISNLESRYQSTNRNIFIHSWCIYTSPIILLYFLSPQTVKRGGHEKNFLRSRANFLSPQFQIRGAALAGNDLLMQFSLRFMWKSPMRIHWNLKFGTTLNWLITTIRQTIISFFGRICQQANICQSSS